MSEREERDRARNWRAARLAGALGTMGAKVGRQGRVTGCWDRETVVGAYERAGGDTDGANDYLGWLRRRDPCGGVGREGVGRGGNGRSVMVFGARMRVAMRRKVGAGGGVVRGADGRAEWERT